MWPSEAGKRRKPIKAVSSTKLSLWAAGSPSCWGILGEIGEYSVM